MLTTLGKLLIQSYGLLLAVAFGGFLGANLAGFVPGIGEHFFNTEGRATPPEIYRRWIHGGWLVGAGLALVAGLLAARRRQAAIRPGDDDRRRKRRESRLRGYSSPRTVLGAAVGGAVGFGLLGAMLGGTFLLLWFSLAYSPFSPAEWGSSVAVETERMAPRSRGVPRRSVVHATEHPVALYLFLGPTLLGLVGGTLLAGVGKMVEKSKR
jgi:hypothetical protein